MTIAAGILCKDGILVCADSEESDYVAKYESEKIHAFENRLLVTGAGSGPYIDMAFDKLREKLSGQWPDHPSSARSMAEGVVYDIHQAHIFDFFGTDPNRPSIDLVLAVRCTNGELALIGSVGSATFLRASTEQGYAGGIVAVGMGRPLFEYWARFFELPTLTLAEAGYLSLFIIREVKENVPGCGGATLAVQMPKDVSAKFPHRMYKEDMILAGFPGSVARVLCACLDLELQDSLAEQKISEFSERLRGLRRAFKQKAQLPQIIEPSGP